MRMTYWAAENRKGDKSEAVIARAKKDCDQKVIAYGCVADYGTPLKKSFLYSDAFDLFEIATAKDGARGMG
jgi:hypothetical protein